VIDTKALRSRILDLAIQGKLTEQLPSDGTAEELYQQIQAEKQALIKEGKIKKEKPLPEISADEIPFEIPSNWKLVRFGTLAQVISGTSYKKHEITSSGIRILRGGNIVNNELVYDESDVFLSNDFYSEEKTIKTGDVLIVASTGSDTGIGRAGIVRVNDNQAQIGAFLRIVRAITNDISDYMDIFFLSSRYTNHIRAQAKGTNINNVKESYITQMTFPLPPLAEQKRIVERVEEIFRLLDTIDEAQEKYSADSQILKAKLITAGIQGKLTKQLPSDGTAEELYQQIQAEKQKLIKEGKLKKEKPLPPVSPEEVPFEIPENWMWVRLVDITTKITSGSTPPGGKKGNSYVPQGFCFFREQNIYNDGIHHDGMVYISEELLNTRENSTVLPNDILLNITGGSIGRCAIIPDDFGKGSINQHILIIRLVEKEMINYIHDLLCSPYYQGIIKSKVVGDKDGFSGGRCKATLIPLPPLVEQKRIADVLEKALGAIDNRQ